MIDQAVEMSKGEVLTLRFFIYDTAGNLLNLTGLEFLLAISANKNSTARLKQKTTVDMTIISLGILDCPLTHDDTDELTAGTLYLELRVDNIVTTKALFKLNESNTNTIT